MTLATLLEALAQTALDVLSAFALLCLGTLIAFGAWCAAVEYKLREREEATSEIREPVDLGAEIRVRDKTRRGPAIEHHGHKRVGL